MIASLLRIPSVRRHAVIANRVPIDMAPAVSAAAEPFALERQRTAWLARSYNPGHLAAIAVFVWVISDLRLATAVLALATAVTLHAADAPAASPNAATTAA